MSSPDAQHSVSNRMFTQAPVYAVKRDAMHTGSLSAVKETEENAAPKKTEIRKANSPTAQTQKVLNDIAESSLSKSQKEAMIYLAAYIDEKEDGNLSYMRDLETLVQMVEAENGGQARQATSAEEVMTHYENERAFISKHADMGLNFSFSFDGFQSQSYSPDTNSDRNYLLLESKERMEGVIDDVLDFADQVLGKGGINIFA